MFFAILLLMSVVGCEVAETTFKVKIENVSHNSHIPTPFSPGVFVVHDQSFNLFVEGEENNGNGLEALAEDGDPNRLREYVAVAPNVYESGVFLSPFQNGNTGLLMPGEGTYEFIVTANSEAQYLSFVTMFVESNDLFFSLDDTGIKLFRFGTPISGGITRRIFLWDTHTEINEKPGQGAYQPLRQTSENSGPSETGPILKVDDQFNYPAISDLVRVTITPQPSETP